MRLKFKAKTENLNLVVNFKLHLHFFNYDASETEVEILNCVFFYGIATTQNQQKMAILRRDHLNSYTKISQHNGRHEVPKFDSITILVGISEQNFTGTLQYTKLLQAATKRNGDRQQPCQNLRFSGKFGNFSVFRILEQMDNKVERELNERFQRYLKFKNGNF